MSALRIASFFFAVTLTAGFSAEVFASEPIGTEATPRRAPAFAPMPIPELMATAASADPESAARALTWLMSRGETDHALLRLLSAGTTQDARIALHFRDRPTEAAIPALLVALERHDDGTSAADATSQALRSCVPSAFTPPRRVMGLDSVSYEEPRAWRDWARRHRRTQTAACLGRSSLSMLPLVVMLLSTRVRRRPLPR